MKNNLHNLQKEAQKIRLSQAEKRAMRARIFAHPQAQIPARSPYMFVHLFSLRMAMSFATVLVLLVGSTSYAAAGALPGDMLYTVKTEMNERVGSALALSSEARANYHASLAQRRMEEAEMLAAEGRLNAEAVEIIESRLAMHVETAEKEAEVLAEKDPGAKAEVVARFSSSLAVHSEILVRLGSESKDSNTQKHSGRLARYVRDNVRETRGSHTSSIALSARATSDTEKTSLMAVQETSMEIGVTSASKLEGKLLEKSTSTSSRELALQKKASLRLESKAKRALKETQEKYKDSQKNLGATTTLDIASKLEGIEARVEAGRGHMEAENYAAAEEEFALAIEEAVRIEALIQASKKYNRSFLNDLLWKGEEEQKKGGTETTLDVQLGV